MWSIYLSVVTIFKSLWFLSGFPWWSPRVVANKEATEPRVHHFGRFTVVPMTWLTYLECLSNKWPRICSTCRKYFLDLSSFMTYHRFVTRLTRHMSLVEQELLTLPEHMSSPPIPVTRSLVLSCFVCPFVLFLLAFVFFVLLRYTDSDYLLYLQTILIVPFTICYVESKIYV